MSTTYRPFTPLVYANVHDQAEQMGLKVHVDPDHINVNDKFALTDGENFLWVYNYGGEAEFCRYGGNDVGGIIETLENHFGVEIISEHDQRFYGEEDRPEEDE